MFPDEQESPHFSDGLHLVLCQTERDKIDCIMTVARHAWLLSSLSLSLSLALFLVQSIASSMSEKQGGRTLDHCYVKRCLSER